MDIQQLAALETIRTVKARYCRFIDLKEWEGLRQLFAPGAQLTFRGVDGQVLYQFDDLQSFIAATAVTLQGAQTIHQVHNPEIVMTSPATATAIWSMEDRILCPPGHDERFKTLHGFGHYYETFQYSGGAWLIKTLDLRRTILNIT